jgi:hypothetical protein
MTRRAGMLGALIFAAPALNARRVGIITAGMEIVGEVVEGEPINGERRWIKITAAYVPMVRVIDEPEEQPRKRRR